MQASFGFSSILCEPVLSGNMAPQVQHIPRVPLKLLLSRARRNKETAGVSLNTGVCIFTKKKSLHSPFSEPWDVLDLLCEVVPQLWPRQHQEMQKGLLHPACPCIIWKDEGVPRRPWLFMKPLKVQSKCRYALKKQNSQHCYTQCFLLKISQWSFATSVQCKDGQRGKSTLLRTFRANSVGDCSNTHRVTGKHPSTRIHWRWESGDG